VTHKVLGWGNFGGRPEEKRAWDVDFYDLARKTWDKGEEGTHFVQEASSKEDAIPGRYPQRVVPRKMVSEPSGGEG